MSLSPIQGAIAAGYQPYQPGDIANSTAGWTLTGDTGGAIAVVTDGGGFKLSTDGTDNDSASVHYGSEPIDVSTAFNTFGFTAHIKGTEGNTDDQDWFVGFADTYADFFSDADALASMDAIGFYKVKDSLFFRTCVLNAAAQSGETTTTAYASATEYRLDVIGRVAGTSGIEVQFYINGVLVDTVTAVSTTGFSNMSPVVAVANGSANAETMRVISFVPYGARR